MQDIYDQTVAYILENQENFYRLAYSYVHNREAALDVVQNAICKALEKCNTLRNPDALKTWLYRILVNEAIQHLRNTRREAELTDAVLDRLVYEEPRYDGDGGVYQQVLRLSEPMKTVIILRYYEDLTLKEIAEVTGTNLSTVKTRLYSGLQKLKKNWKEQDV